MLAVSSLVRAQRILVVEDEPNARVALCELLRTSGYACASAADGVEALELTESFRPQAIIMDLLMPRLDGFETTRRLKADWVTRAIPILALTSSVTSEERRQAAQAGVDDFLTKPVDLPDLLQHLHQHLNHSRKLAK
jgi:CheY-like chemotaxis protein